MSTLFTVTARDGLKLATHRYGWENDDPVPVVCLPGLTRTALDFHGLATVLASSAGGNRRVLCIDYRGRGASEHDRNWENYNLLTEADDVITCLVANGIRHIDVVGTSRGGMITMLLGAIRPGILRRIVLNDIGPELDGTGLMRIKHSTESPQSPANHEAAADYLERLHGLHFPAFDKADWARVASTTYEEDEKGGLNIMYDRNLAKTLRSLNLDVRLPDLWPQFSGLRKFPTLLLRGELSDLLTPEITRRMQEVHTDLTVHEVSGQGHAPDLSTAGLPAVIAAFLQG